MLLEELIARQRFSLNRTVRLARRQPPLDNSTAEQAAQLADTERFLADNTRQLAEFLDRMGNFRFEFLHQAEAQMLAAAALLQGAEVQQSVTPEKAALTALIKARNRVKELLKESDPTSGLQAIRDFDRRQAQKLRWSGDKSKMASELASRLRQAAQQERQVQGTLQQMSGIGGSGDRKAVAKQQRSIVDDVSDIAREVRRADGVSQLAQHRMRQALEKVEEVSGTLLRGNTEDAAEAAKTAVPMLEELARHIDGLLGRDVANRIAAARDVSDFLARRQRELAEALPTPGSPGSPGSPSPASQKGRDNRAGKASQSSAKGTAQTAARQAGSPSSAAPSPNSQTLPQRATAQVQTGRTLDDLLRALALAEEAGSREATRQVERTVQQGEMARVMDQMQRFSESVRQGDMEAAGTQSQELVNLLDAMTQRLDRLHRSMVAPRVDAMLALEQRAAKLLDRLKTLQSESEIDQWHRDASQLTDQLRTSDAAAESGRSLQQAMQQAGWGSRSGGWNWNRKEGYYGAPGSYGVWTQAIVRDLDLQVRELLLRGTIVTGNEAVPPQYEELVDRYYRVLSEEEQKP